MFELVQTAKEMLYNLFSVSVNEIKKDWCISRGSRYFFSYSETNKTIFRGLPKRLHTAVHPYYTQKANAYKQVHGRITL